MARLRFTCLANYRVELGRPHLIGAKKQNRANKARFSFLGSPNQIRTGVLALKGRCPRPLDDGAKTATNLNDFIQICWLIITAHYIFVKIKI